jgi:hypothetical protein
MPTPHVRSRVHSSAPAYRLPYTKACGRRVLNIQPQNDLELLVLAGALAILRFEELQGQQAKLMASIEPAVKLVAEKVNIRKSYDEFVAQSIRRGLAFIRDDGRVVFRPPTDAERQKYGLKKDGEQNHERHYHQAPDKKRSACSGY